MPRLLLLAALAVFAAPAALAQTCSTEWANASGGAWDTASNWTNGVPGSQTGGLNPCITAPGTYTVLLSQGLQQSTSVASLVIGGASGVQTLSTATVFSVTGDVSVRPNGRWLFVNRTPGGEDGLYAPGTVTVEGEIIVPGGVSFLTTGGTLDVAPGGTLRLTTAASTGAPSGLFRVRGTIEGAGCPVPNAGECSVRAPVEVLGGTLRAVDGVLRTVAGGTVSNATLHAGPTGVLVLNADIAPDRRFVVEGLIQGTPQGSVLWASGDVAAGPAGVTLALGGTGTQLTGSVVLTSAGGSFTNTGLLKEDLSGSNFSGIRDGIVRNQGVVELPAGFGLYVGGVLVNEPGGIVRATGQSRLAGDGNGTGRFENAGLLEVAPGASLTFSDGGFGNNSGPFSQPGSEMRVAGTLDLVGPGSRNLPAGVAVTGTGTLGMTFALDPEGTISPGTDADPLAMLTVANYFRPSLVAGDPRLVIDVDADGRSDTLAVLFAPGSQNTRLGGTLVVRVRPGYAPQAGDAFTILTSGSAIDGAFSGLEVDGPPDAVFDAAISTDGLSVVLTATVSVAAEDAPGTEALAFGVAALSTPSPQPALRVTLAEPATLVVEVYDVRGRRVARLADEARGAGVHALPVAGLVPGVYLARVVAAGPSGVERATQRLVVVR